MKNHTTVLREQVNGISTLIKLDLGNWLIKKRIGHLRKLEHCRAK